MGQRKKGNKFFRWMRLSDLQNSTDDPTRTQLLQLGGSKIVDTAASGPRTSIDERKSTLSNPIKHITNNNNNNEDKEVANDLKIFDININSDLSADTIDRNDSLACSLNCSNKIGQTSPKFSVVSTKETVRNNLNAQHNSLSSSNDNNQGANDCSSLSKNGLQRKNDITEIIKSDVKNLTDCLQKKRLNFANSPKKSPKRAPSFKKEKSLERKLSDKKIACRLYECFPAKCTARNESSCEPTEVDSLTPSIKLNLELSKYNISRNSELSKKKFLNVMDRSVDSIGSCSLDVDADSTDFSDTSGSFNLCTPSSGKDFTREFTSRIHERCQIGQIICQKATAILDPTSGKISTILSSTTTAATALSSSDNCTLPVSPAKKPSYLNLACCVNGYSNLTTYDSKLRQNINKSREVSPIRPITHTLHYNRAEGNNYLVVPVPVAANANDTKENYSRMMNSSSLMSPEKRYFTSPKNGELNGGGGAVNGKDVTDNLSNGFYKSSYLSSTTTNATVVKDEIELTKSPKSFIQQRVERLYGPGALAQGFYSPKRSNSDSSSSILSERSQNSTNTVQTKIFKTEYKNGTAAGVTTTATTTTTLNSSFGHSIELENLNFDDELQQQQSLPVLRHLRPEFRAQLPILSPKRSPQSKTLLAATDFTTSNGKHSTINGGDSLSSETHVVHQQHYNNKIASHKQQILKTSNNFNNNNIDDDENIHIITSSNIRPVVNGSSSANSSGGGAGSGGSVVSDTVNSVHKMKLSEDINLCDKKRSNGHIQIDILNGDVEPTTVPIVVPVPAAAAPQQECVTNENLKSTLATTVAAASDAVVVEKDGYYFLNILKIERDRLIALAVTAESYMDFLSEKTETPDEEIFGHLRSAAGKARLLATQKIRQFEGLCHNSINHVPGEKFGTTAQDLEGFWDMVMLQVVDVDSNFKEIETFRKNNWQKPPPEKKAAPPTGSKLIKRPLATRASAADSNNTANGKLTPASMAAKKSAASLAAAEKREAQRKQLLELKRKHKEKIAAAGSPVAAEGEAVDQNVFVSINDS